MLISETLNAALNNQIREELGNSSQYLAIASYFDAEGLRLETSVAKKLAEPAIAGGGTALATVLVAPAEPTS